MHGRWSARGMHSYLWRNLGSHLRTQTGLTRWQVQPLVCTVIVWTASESQTAFKHDMRAANSPYPDRRLAARSVALVV